MACALLGLKPWVQYLSPAGPIEATKQMASQSKDDLGRRTFRTDGRLVVSFPKSGRTWLRFALLEAEIDATFTHAGAATNRREIGRPYSGIPQQLAALPLVFLHRNPLDTAVSMFYQVHHRDLRRWSGRWLRMWVPLALRKAHPPRSIDEFVLHPLYGVPKICRYNRLWLNHLAGRNDCLVITYEAMRQAPAKGFQNLLDHWSEIKVSGQKLAELSAFDRMRAIEQSESAPFLTSRRPGDVSSAKVRKGKVHGYFDELRPETIQYCNEIASQHGFV